MTFGRMPAHTSTNGWPTISTLRIAHLRGEARLLGAGDEVVEQHAEAALRARLELGHGTDEVVGAVQRLDDDAELAQVVAPHVLDQLGVVAALDPDPAGAGDVSPAPASAAATEPLFVCFEPAAFGATVGRTSVTGPARRAGTRPP